MLMTDHVKLAQPLKVGENTITEVTIRRPKVRDLQAMEEARKPGASEIDQAIAIAAMLCGIPLEAVGDLDAADFAAISEVIAGFFPQGAASSNGAAS